VKSLLFLLVAMLVGLGLGLGLWLMRDPAQLTKLTDRAKQSVAPAMTSATTSTTSPLRKCKRGNEVLYTNDKCPAGTQEDAVKGGSLSVLPAGPVVAPAVDQGASEPSLKDKRMDKIIGQ
jgi:hypothetical protein